MPSPLHRTNLNLYAEDVVYLQSRYGWGWTNAVRELVRQHVKLEQSFDQVVTTVASHMLQEISYDSFKQRPRR